MKTKEYTSNLAVLQTYYRLTKPGIIYGNILTATAGFLLASKGHVDMWLLLATLAGTALVIASGCVCNNVIDRRIDRKMARTKRRALARGQVSPGSALIYASVLGIVGFALLTVFTNAVTVLVGCVGLFFYLVMYSIWKRRSAFGTIVGSVSGATPIVAGYTAVSGHLDTGAVILFLIMTFWQMPHFYAIAMYRLKDYAAANIPVLPIQRGMRATKLYIVLFISAFIAACCLLAMTNYAGLSFLVVMTFLGAIWLGRGIQGFKAHADEAWARQMFFFSLTVLLGLSITLSLNSLLP